MGWEDFTTYTVTDESGDFMIMPDKITVDTLERDDVSHITKDFTANHFNDYEHLIDSKCTAMSANDAYGAFWGVTTSSAFTYVDVDAANNGILLYWWYSTNLYCYLKNFESTETSDSTTLVSIGTQYYFTITKSGTTFTVDIYSDTSRETLVDTLSITVPDTTKQYLLVAGSREAEGTMTSSYTVENLELQEDAYIGPDIILDSRSNYGNESYLSTLDYAYGSNQPKVRIQTTDY